jgi:RNA polymerase sigma-70 factor (ECF subfamily)
MDADDRLVTALADDLDATFDALVLAHQDRLYTIALRMLGDARDAEEAAQDALVRAYRALASYDPARIRELRLRGWLTTIVLNRCRSVGARRAARGPRPVSIEGDPARPAAEVEAPPSAAPSEVAERRAERDRWAARLTALPAPYRAAIVLRHVDGMSYPEVAATLSRPEGTVKAQVHRGIAQLRTMLEAEARREPEEMTA